ncbi:MAG TPA: zinc ABC transporter ATP-binding protein AztA [Acidimicrobiales bacterium]|jgi:manganese transport system ATP-binding protein|nr:zinc ABC transporter ATP-binding protein AztA [Acidimicrobiales bacterium]
MAPHPPAVVADDLVLAYGHRVALAAVSFEIPTGASVALIGPNGSGKSTLLRAIAGLISPLSGGLGVPARRVRSAVAVVLQSTAVDPYMPITVGETVAMARYARRGPLRRLDRADRAAVQAALERLDVADLASRQLNELSGGQRQRVLVAQGLAQEADLLLLDEPVTGLDVVSRQLILEAVAAEREAGRTVVMSTHDLGDARVAERVMLLANRLVAYGTPDEVLTDRNLGAAYGGRVLALPLGAVLVDDPHHDAPVATPAVRRPPG